jgi:hypothetical protein
VLGTRRLVEGVLNHGPSVRTFVHGSAIGFYGDRGDATLNAASARGTGFLADVVDAWEAELRPLTERRPDVRAAVVRTGIVLARHGGALARLSQVAVVLMRIDSVLSRKWLMRNEPDCADCL